MRGKKEFHIRNVAVNDLYEADMTVVRDKIKGCSLDVGPLQGPPLEVITGELRVRRLLGLLGNGSNGRWAVDGLLSAGDIGQPSGSERVSRLANMRPIWVQRGRNSLRETS